MKIPHIMIMETTVINEMNWNSTYKLCAFKKITNNKVS